MNIFSSRSQDFLVDVAEPTDAELEAIDAEWPAIEADLILLDVELSAYASRHAMRVNRVKRRRTRRVLSEAVTS